MDPEIEDIKRRLSVLEKQDSPSVQPKPEKKKNDYRYWWGGFYWLRSHS